MKKLFLFACLCLILTACKEQKNNIEKADIQPATEEQLNISLPDNIEQETFSFEKDSLPPACQSKNEIICAIENVVKCALDPHAPYCDKKTMPDFLFFDDAMFAEGDVEGRPTKQSFNIIKAKILDQNTIEILTKGECDKNWFGACRGNVIYVMNNKTGKWQVDEVYAVETIR